METVSHHIIIKMSALDNVFMGYIVVTCDEPAPAYVERRACPGHEGLLTAGDILPEQFHRLRLALSYFKLGFGHIVTVNDTSRNLEIALNEHQVIIVKSGYHRGHADLPRFFLEFTCETAVETYNFSGLAAAYAISELIGAAMGIEM